MKDEKCKPEAAEDEPQPEGQHVYCNACGYHADIVKFLQQDTGDTICPRCQERDDHTYAL